MTSHRYDSADLLRLRTKACICVKREVRRRLKFFRIYVDHIPIRISSRGRRHRSERHLRRECRLHGEHRPLKKQERNLVYCSTSGHQSRSPKVEMKFPSLLLSNVRSLCNKMDEVEHRVVSSNPDIVAFTETWLDFDTPDSSISLCGYNIARKDRNKHGGGIIVYVSVSLKFEIMNFCDVITSYSCESEILTLVFPTRKIILIVIYHPFWKDALRNESAISCITDIIERIYTLPAFCPQSTKVIVCGDFNDLVDDTDDLESSFGLHGIVLAKTRGNRTLDQIFTNITSQSEPKVSAPFGRSDHAVVMWRPCETSKSITTKKKVRDFSKVNKCNFESAMSLVNWSIIESYYDIDFAISVFYNVLSFLYDACFPWITVRFRSNDPPWMNATLKVLMYRRDRAFYKNHRLKYIRLRTQVINYNRVLKRNYLLELESACNNSDAWKRYKTVARVKQSDVWPADVSVSGLNDYFSSVFQESGSLPLCPSDVAFLPDEPLEVTDLQVNFYLQRLRKGFGGPDGIPFWVFKNTSVFISSAIAFIFNNCFKNGVFPTVFKFADIVPIPKVAKPSSPSDFRPISVLPVLSKVMEKIVVSRWILPHVSSKLSPSQFAYVPGTGKGTATALTLINHLVLDYLDKKSGAVRMLAADFSKAFDKVSFNSIISALLKFCLPRQAVTFLCNFLCNRKQRVRLNFEVSNWCSITSGVPQGSVLGPILFSMVIDSYSPICNNSMCIKYADDVTVLHFIHAETEDFLQSEWSHLESWSDSVGLRLNREKSCVMNYITKKSLNLVSVKANDGVILPTVSSLRLLGVTFSSDFTWNLHVQNIVNKCYKRFFILRNLKRASCPPSIIHKCYVAFIRSILLYSFPCFCNLPQYLFNKIIRLERRATSYFSDYKFCSVQEATSRICERLFKDILNSCDHPLRVLFEARVPTPRNDCVLRAPLAKTTRFYNSFIRYGRFNSN